MTINCCTCIWITKRFRATQPSETHFHPFHPFHPRIMILISYFGVCYKFIFMSDNWFSCCQCKIDWLERGKTIRQTVNWCRKWRTKLACEIFRLVKRESRQKCENSFQFTYIHWIILFPSITWQIKSFAIIKRTTHGTLNQFYQMKSEQQHDRRKKTEEDYSKCIILPSTSIGCILIVVYLLVRMHNSRFFFDILMHA